MPCDQQDSFWVRFGAASGLFKRVFPRRVSVSQIIYYVQDSIHASSLMRVPGAGRQYLPGPARPSSPARFLQRSGLQAQAHGERLPGQEGAGCDKLQGWRTHFCYVNPDFWLLSSPLRSLFPVRPRHQWLPRRQSKRGCNNPRAEWPMPARRRRSSTASTAPSPPAAL